MKRILYLLVILPVLILTAQNSTSWNGKKCAVILTYDDALNVHLDNVIPVLDANGFKGTFYVPGYSSVINERMNEWRAITSRGHELGNHTLFHPCDGSQPNREWVSGDFDLSTYTFNRIAEEIKTASVLLKAIDGKSERTFAYTCGDTEAGDSSFTELIKDNFIGARGVEWKVPKYEEVDINNFPACMIMGQTGEELINMVKEAIQKNLLLVFLFHGVGGEHSIDVSLEAHNQLVEFLKQNERDIWVAPLVDVAKFLNQNKN